jgi:conjugal transfer/entry exclusion protein
MKRLVMIGLFGLVSATALWASDTKSSKETYLKKAENEVQEWTTKLKSLQERSEKSGAKTREELDRHLKRLSDQLSIARKQLGETRGAGEDRWKNFRQGLEETLRDIKRDYRRAVAYFNSTETKEKKHE